MMASTTRALRSKITVKLGLVSFHVKLHSARDEAESATTVCCGTEAEPHQLTKTKQTLACPNCKSESWGDFKRAMDVGGDEYVLLPPDLTAWTEDELKRLGNEIELSVHDAAEVETSTLPGEKFYFMEPQTQIAVEAYSLLVDRVLVRTDRAFVFEFAIRGVPAFYRLGVVNSRLVAKELCRPGLVRTAPVVNLIAPSAAAIKLADDAIAAVKTPFQPEAHGDKRKALIDAFVATQVPIPAVGSTPTEGAKAPVLDMMAALQASVDAAAGKVTPAPKARKAPAKRAAAKKAAPRKAAAAKAVPAARSSRQKVS